ncbi:MAG TPA: hypothetical protein VF310_16575, partial [Vicinamibacteria bacterium]
FREPRLSPRGDRIALRIGPPDAAEVWIYDLASGTLSQLTFGMNPWHPSWTPDGKSLAVSAESEGRWRLLLLPVGGGAPRVLYESESRMYPGDFTPDGRFLCFQELHPERGWDVAALELGPEGGAVGPPQLLASSSAHETYPRFSPDGRWVAYASDELDGSVGVYVVPFGRPGVRVNPSREGGRWPVWGGPGELYYWNAFPAELHRVSWSEEGGAFRVRADEALWSADRRGQPPPPQPAFDFDRAHRRIVFLKLPVPEAPPPEPQLTLFQGWGEEVRRRTAAAR